MFFEIIQPCSCLGFSLSVHNIGWLSFLKFDMLEDGGNVSMSEVWQYNILINHLFSKILSSIRIFHGPQNLSLGDFPLIKDHVGKMLKPLYMCKLHLFKYSIPLFFQSRFKFLKCFLFNFFLQCFLFLSPSCCTISCTSI